MTFLTHRPLRTLGALGAVLAAVGITLGSGAAFTASSANPSNTFAAGTLSILNSKEGTAVLTASNLKPGSSESGTVDVKNTGSLDGVFTVSKSGMTNSDATYPMTAKLNLVVTDCGAYDGATPPDCGDLDDAIKYSGTISAMGSTALGTFQADEHHRYQFAVELDSSADNNYQGDSASVQFDWNAA